MVNQILIANGMIGVCEGLLYASKAGTCHSTFIGTSNSIHSCLGLDLTETIAAVGSGAAGSWSINNLGPRIVAGNFEPGFFVEHFIKA